MVERLLFEVSVHRFNWSPGIGDPTFMGWLTVVLYLLTAWLSWRIAQRLDTEDSRVAREKNTWRVIAVLFLFLGINKQLDLQSGFTELGRVVAHAQGWYDRRFGVQIAFIASIAVASFLAALLLSVLNARVRWPNWLAVLGTILVLGYVFVRAASLQHVDWFIHQAIVGAKWNWIMEIGGISLVLVSAARRFRIIPDRPTISVHEPK